MAHFAKIDNDGLVLQVLTLDNSVLLENGVENETLGQQYLETHNNWPSNQWIQTSYNTFENKHRNGGTPFRGNYASIGYTWDVQNQIFWPPKPFVSWVKYNTEARWQSPIGDAPALTAEQLSQTQAGTHRWVYLWDENAYQQNSNNGWILLDLFSQ